MIIQLFRRRSSHLHWHSLAWAHQSIIQRKRLPLGGDPRYSVSLGQGMSNTRNIFSIRSKSGDRYVRYEVGDLIQFSNGKKKTKQGRVVGITLEKGKKCKLEIQILVRSFLGFENHQLIRPSFLTPSRLSKHTGIERRLWSGWRSQLTCQSFYRWEPPQGKHRVDGDQIFSQTGVSAKVIWPKWYFQSSSALQWISNVMVAPYTKTFCCGCLWANYFVSRYFF